MNEHFVNNISAHSIWPKLDHGYIPACDLRSNGPDANQINVSILAQNSEAKDMILGLNSTRFNLHQNRHEVLKSAYTFNWYRNLTYLIIPWSIRRRKIITKSDIQICFTSTILILHSNKKIQDSHNATQSNNKKRFSTGEMIFN